MRHWITVLSIAALLPAAAPAARAGAKLEISDQSHLELGIRLQTLALSSEKDGNGDGSYESYEDFIVRRARLRLKAVVNPWVSGFLQTESVDDEETFGLDSRVIDAFITVAPCDWFQVIGGQNMAPASRQNLTSSGALLAIDRPGLNYKTLTWGTRSLLRFSTSTYTDSDAGLRGEADVRDVGATLFGAGSLTDTAHLKYYAGVYNGAEENTADDEQRFTGRVQCNFFGAEPAYYNSATYLGLLKTIGLGAAYDLQDGVAVTDDGNGVDYAFYTLDVFTEYPVGPGSVTFEAAYQNLDLDDAAAIDLDGDPETPGRDARRAQGDGYYAQAGYYYNQWQPWVAFESWEADAGDGKGSYDLYRVGATYFIDGHHANIKAGLEQFKADANIGDSNEDSVRTVVVGLYLTY